MQRILLISLIFFTIVLPVQAQRIEQTDKASDSPSVKRNQLQLLTADSKANLIFKILERRIEAMIKRLDKMNNRISRLLARADTTQANIARYEDQIAGLNRKIIELKISLDTLKEQWQAYSSAPEKEKYALIKTDIQDLIKEINDVIAEEKNLLRQINRYKLKIVQEGKVSPSETR